MKSCDEACFHFTKCGETGLHRTGNNIPCEKLCSHAV